jgi:hypothetical protein
MVLAKAAFKLIRDRREWNSSNNRMSRKSYPAIVPAHQRRNAGR